MSQWVSIYPKNFEDLMTCDVEYGHLSLEKPEKKVLTRQEKKMKKVKARIERNRYKMQALANQIAVSSTFDDDPDMRKMRECYSPEFFTIFNAGFDCYLKGDWI